MAILSAGFFYFLAGYFLHSNHGHYDPFILFYTCLYFLCNVAMISRSKTFQDSVFVSKLFGLQLSLGIFFFLCLTVDDPVIVYRLESSAGTGFQYILKIATFLAAWLFFAYSNFLFPGGKRGLELSSKSFKVLAGAIGILLLVAQVLVPYYSPKPFIDVFVSNSAGVDYFLSGINPYSQTYVDIYNGAIPGKAGLVYFPGLLYWLAPFKFLFGDLRFGFVAAHFLIALFVYRIAKRRGKDRITSSFAWLFPLLWLSFPVVYFVIEQSWIDTLLVLVTVVILDALDLSLWNWAGVLLGLVFSMKQHGFIISFFALLRIGQLAGLRQASKSFALAAGTFALLLSPFLYSDWRGFLEMTVMTFSAISLRLNSFGMADFIAIEWGYILPHGLQLGIAGMGILLGAVLVLKDPLKKLDRVAASLFFSYGCAFLFGMWAYCNYHYLLISFLLLYLATATETAFAPDL